MHTNWWLNFSGKKMEQMRKRFAKGHFGKVVCLSGLYIPVMELSSAWILKPIHIWCFCGQQLL